MTAKKVQKAKATMEIVGDDAVMALDDETAPEKPETKKRVFRVGNSVYGQRDNDGGIVYLRQATALDMQDIPEEPVNLGDETVAELVEETILPEPKPGDADYDWSADYGTSDLYTHKFPNGIVVALKPFGDIFSKTWLYKIRNLKTNIDIELAAIDRGTCDAAKDVLESLEDTDKVDPIAELWTAWSKSATSNGDGDDGLTSGN